MAIEPKSAIRFGPFIVPIATAILGMKQHPACTQEIKSFRRCAPGQARGQNPRPVRPWHGRSRRGRSCHYRRRHKKSNLQVGASAKSTSAADEVQVSLRSR
jgi:hypothetical protein